MNLSKGRIAIAGISILFVTVLLNFPANVAAGWVKRNAEIPFEWQAIEGTIFNADIYGLSIPTTSGNVIYIDRTSLITSKIPLLLGNFVSEIHAINENSEIFVKCKLTFNGWEISNLKGELVLSDFAHSFPEFELFGITGIIFLESELIVGNYRQLSASGNLSLEIFNLNSAMLDTARSLGDYQMLVNIDSTRNISASIKNLSGDNQLYINSILNFGRVDKKIRINGYAWLSDNADKSLSELLSLLGKQENNRVLINWESNVEF